MSICAAHRSWVCCSKSTNRMTSYSSSVSRIGSTSSPPLGQNLSTCGTSQIRRHRGGLGMDAFLLLFSVYTDYSTLDRKNQYSFQKPLQFLPSYRCWLIHSLCLRAYLPEEVAKLNDIAEMRAGTKLEKPLRSEYLTISGTCFINQSSPVITISKNGIRFSKACHTRLDDCEHVELLYHPILQVVILRKSNRDASTAIRWENKDKICSSFSSKAFSGVIFEAMNWKWSCRYQCRGICRGEENAKFLIFELDESRILIRKNQYEQIEDRSMNLKCRLYRSKWVQSITVSDVMESGQVVENPMIGAIPSRNEVQRELDDLLMSM